MTTQDSADQHWTRTQRTWRWGSYLLLALQALLFLGWGGVLVASWTTGSSQLTTASHLMLAGIGLLFLLQGGYLFFWPQPLWARTRTLTQLKKALPVFPFAMGAGFFLKGVLQVVFPTSSIPSLLVAGCGFAGIFLIFHLIRKATTPQ
jgi:hypothetical protein